MQRDPTWSRAEAAAHQVELVGGPRPSLVGGERVDQRAKVDGRRRGPRECEVRVIRALLGGQTTSTCGGTGRVGQPTQPIALTVHPCPQHPVTKPAAAAERQRQWGVPTGRLAQPPGQLITALVVDLAEEGQRQMPLLGTAPAHGGLEFVQRSHPRLQLIDHASRWDQCHEQPHVVMVTA